MTDIFRRRLFGAAAATGLAAVPAHAARVDADEELLKKDYPAGRRSAALGQPAPMPEPEARLSGTYDLGASTLNEGEVINASRWGVVYAHVQGGKMTHLRPFEFDYAPSPNLISAIFRTRRLASVSRWFAKAGSRTTRRAVAAAAKRSSCPSPGKRHSTSWQAK